MPDTVRIGAACREARDLMTDSQLHPAAAAAETAVRNAYGRLVAWLAWQWRDIAAAEDALSDALVAALKTWPAKGIPESPEAWLMTAARRNLLKGHRRRRMEEDPALTILHVHDDSPVEAPRDLPDERLRLMLVCAHPSIDPAVRSALMLQVVLGLDAAQIARGFIVSTETMTKRLVRAKAKIRQAGIRFEEPERRELPTRINAVLEAVYAAYTLEWDRSDTERCGNLRAEAWFLADLVVSLLQDNAEAMGLLTLIELCEARKPAAIVEGQRVPLHEQDAQAWDAGLIRRAAARLTAASRLAMTGPYQIEAAIQMAHCSRQQSGSTPWGDIRVLYERLLAVQPTVGAVVGYALACGYASGHAAAGLAVLDGVGPGVRAQHQPWWAARAHLLDLAGRPQEAITAYDRAIALAQSDDTRRALRRRRTLLSAY